MSGRNRNIVVAAVLAVLAALLTMLYVSRASGSTNNSGQKAAAVQTAPVLVATKDLPAGESLAAAIAAGSVRVERLDAESIQPGAMTSLDAVKSLVVVQPIYRGEQVSAERVGKSGAAGLRSQLHGTERVAIVPGDADQLLAGVAQTGDRVDVVVAVQLPGSSAYVTKVALRNVLLLRAATASSSGSATSPTANGSGPMTAELELTDAQAQQLYYAMEYGKWSFVLRPAVHAKQSSLKPTTAATLARGD